MTIYDALQVILGDIPDDFMAFAFILCGIAFLMFLSWLFELIFEVILRFFGSKR